MPAETSRRDIARERREQTDGEEGRVTELEDRLRESKEKEEADVCKRWRTRCGREAVRDRAERGPGRQTVARECETETEEEETREDGGQLRGGQRRRGERR
jgi:hypothetical protein